MAEGKQQRKEEKDVQSIIRIAGKDVNGALSIERALSRVKGIGMNMSHAISHSIEKKLGIDKATGVGSLTEKQVSDIEALIKAPDSVGIPKYMLNKRKDFDTGRDVHHIGNDLVFSTRQDIGREINMRTWKGFRHQYGQRVRGQHTRSTGRTGAPIGVMKKSIKAQQAASQAQQKGKEQPKAAAAAPAK